MNHVRLRASSQRALAPGAWAEEGGLASAITRDAEEEHMRAYLYVQNHYKVCVYIYRYMCIYSYIYIYVCIYIYIYTHMSLYIYI